MIFAALALLLAAPRAAPQSCTHLSASLDGQDGAFDGMSHSGVLLVLQNTGPAACRTPGLPVLSFMTRGGRRLDVARRTPPGMHPGPVIVPVTLVRGAKVTTALRWVSGNVYDNGRCLTPAKIVVQAGGQRIVLPFGRQLCGSVGTPVPFDQSVLQAEGPPRA